MSILHKLSHQWPARLTTAAVLTGIVLLGTAGALACGNADAAERSSSRVPVRSPDGKVDGVEVATLTDAPNVPPPITRRHPAKVIVNLEVIEKTAQIDEGVTYPTWTFGGSVPGKFIRVREGDVVELHLKNAANNTMPHNIDLHAVTGPGGGAGASLTLAGHESVFTFTALNPGLFIYHCATSPVPMHLANGMYGMILVEPKEGLPAVDREYYVMQSEFYTTGKHGDRGLQQLDMDKGIDERPTYVVFNGAVGGLTTEHPLKAKVGETVRLFFGVGGPNKISSFHIIGEIMDRVFDQASLTSPALTDVQTTLVPPGGATMVELQFQVPGRYIFLDHAIARMQRGLAGYIIVDGAPAPEIFNGTPMPGSGH